MAIELYPESYAAEQRTTLTRLSHHHIEGDDARLDFVIEQQAATVDEYTILVPGFYGIHSAYVGLRQETARQNPQTGVISMHPPRRASLRHADHILPIAVWEVMKATAEQTGASRFNLVGHSMGGSAAIHAAEYIRQNKAADLIGQVTLNAAAGVTDHNLLTLGPRAGRLLRRELLPNRQALVQNLDHWKAAQEVASYTLHPQTILEMLAVCRSNILSNLGRLSDAGVSIGALYFPQDPLFDAERAERNLRGRVQQFAVLEMPAQAGHIAPQLFPREVAQANLRLTMQAGR
jgi:pimeloyl-ACP methyl ester carboxylesterase